MQDWMTMEAPGGLILSQPQLGDHAAAYVRGLIMSGDLRPGEIVQPNEIASVLGISRTPVREALQALRATGFLVLVPRHGFQVASLTARDIRDLFEGHALISGELAARAAARLTDGDADELKARHHELCAAARRRDAAQLKDRVGDFFNEIHRIADAPKLTWFLVLMDLYSPDFPIDLFVQSSEQELGEILDRLVAHDPEGARATVARHIEIVGETVARDFEARAGEGGREPSM